MNHADALRASADSDAVQPETVQGATWFGESATVVDPAAGAAEAGDPPPVPAHRLLRPIGRGSYGTIWLAVNAMGTHRAVKVVYRSQFMDARPYEREYDGVKLFEPISRSHDGFVDILQVERNDEAGYFYYVMELADDIERGQQIAPDSYTPRTLAAERAKRGSLHLSECLQIGLSLSATLEHLHNQSRVHRDIKEANIVFINGMPKLADIGLVSDIRADSTFVGTPGFIPPEGPGAPAADIYSLGKVLYEISTGLNRSEFPGLPDGVPVTERESEFQEWHAILVKACEDNVTLRYQSATELHAHLALIRAGKSVKRLLQFERFATLVRRYSPIAAALLLVIPLVLFLVIRERERAAEDRQRQTGSYVAYGSRALGDGESLAALPWFVRALELDGGEAARALTHRVRLGSVLQHSPRLIQIRFHQHEWGQAEFGATDTEILSPFADQRHAVWDVAGGRPRSPLIGTGKHPEERAVFSRDFRRIVTANADTFARVWDAQTGQLLVECGHDGWVIHARFNAAGDRLVTTENGSVEAQIWNLETGRRERLLHGHPHPLWYADFSPDGRRVVATSFEGQAIIWDAVTGDPVLTFTGHSAWVRCAAFSLDSRLVATASGDHTARVWEADTGREVLPPLRHGDHVMRVQFSPDGRWLITACLDGTVHIWDVLTGHRAFPTLTHSTRIVDAAFSPSGSRVLAVAIDGTVFVWELRKAARENMTGPIAFSGDGLRSAQFTNGHVQISRVADGHVLASLPAAEQAPARLWLDSEGVTLVKTFTDQTAPGGIHTAAQIWDTRTGGVRGSIIRFEGASINLALSSSGRRMAAAGHSHVAIHDTATGNRLARISRASVPRLAWDTSGNRLALAWDKTVEVWDVRDLSPRLVSSITNDMNITHLEFSPNDRWLLVSTSDSTLKPGAARLWDPRTGVPAGLPLPHRDGVLHAAFSPNGDRIVTCGEDFTAVLWESKSGRRLPLQPIKHGDQVLHAAFSRNGLWVLTVERSGKVSVWDALTGERVTSPLWTLPPPVSARFLANDRRLATVSEDGTVRLWELHPDDRPVQDLNRIAGLLVGRPVDPSDPLQARSDAELHETWEYLRGLYPHDFSPDP